MDFPRINGAMHCVEMRAPGRYLRNERLKSGDRMGETIGWCSASPTGAKNIYIFFPNSLKGQIIFLGGQFWPAGRLLPTPAVDIILHVIILKEDFTDFSTYIFM